MKKADVLAQIRTDRVLGLADALPAGALADCARALQDGGIHCLEVAMTTPAAIPALERASTAVPGFCLGLGTVLDPETARNAILAGASFVVMPAPRPDVITLCRRFNTPVISGSFTPADIAAAQQAGADAVKVYPGELFGPVHLRAMLAAVPEARMIPIGGVTPESIAEFLRAGAIAAYAGNSLLPAEAVAARRWSEVTMRARAFRAAVDAFAASAA